MPVATRPPAMRRLTTDATGSIGIIFCCFMFTIVLAVGMAVDLLSMAQTRTRLHAALDAAVLAAAGAQIMVGETQQQQVITATGIIQSFLAVALPANIANAAKANVQVQINAGQVTATTSVPNTPLFSGVMPAWANTVSVSSTAVRSGNSSYMGMEVALVLDNTGSMLTTPSGATEPNMAALKQDAASLVQKLFSSLPGSSTLRIALVPYVASVNPGAVAQTLTGNATAPTPGTASGWTGCVIEPSATFNNFSSTLNYQTVATKLDASSGSFGVYKWPAEVSGRGGCVLQSDPSTTTSQGNCNTYTPNKASTMTPFPWPWTTDNSAVVGPNRSCPIPITPLSSNEQTLLTAIGLNADGSANESAGMGPINGGGTIGSLGMAWGYRVLSPTGYYAATSAPAAWNGGVTKVVVLMTDGVNEFFDNQYSGFGLYNNWNVSTIDTQEEAVCDALRSKGVIIYTVSFTGATPTAALSYCAGTAPGSGNANYAFTAATQSQLAAAFNTIGNQLANLRLSQ